MLWSLHCPNNLQVGAPKAHAYSWNTQVNRYYGDDTREYIARYDRVYVRGLEATVYQLVANEPRTEAGGQRWLGGTVEVGALCASVVVRSVARSGAADGDQRAAQPKQVGREAGARWARFAMVPAALLHFWHPVQTFAGDFLSDHFGVLCELQVAPGPVASPPPNRAVAAAAAAKRQRLSPSASRAAAAGHSPVRLFG